MEELCDFRRHPYTVALDIGNTQVYYIVSHPANRYNYIEIMDGVSSKDACIIYNKKKQVLSWGDRDFEVDDEDYIKIDNFKDKLYLAFENIKDGKTENGSFFLQAMYDYMRLVAEELETELAKKCNNINRDKFHYIFTVPSDWEESIKELLIRPIFVDAGLIFEDDHKDRLLFYSDIESIIYRYQHPDYCKGKKYFERGQNTILCRFTPLDYEVALIKLDLISTMNNLFDIPKSMLFPKIVSSSSITISSDDIKNGIKLFLTKLFPFDRDQVIEIIAQDIYNSKLPNMDKDNKDEEDCIMELPWIKRKIEWGLYDYRKLEIIESIHPFEICAEISKTLFESMKNVISNNLVKKYRLLRIDDGYSSEIHLDYYVASWIKLMLEYNRRFLNKVTTIDKINVDNREFYPKNIVTGASTAALEVRQNAESYCRPRILPMKDSGSSSSIFLNSKPDAIININISQKSTLLSFLVLSDEGSTEEILDHNYFTADNCLPFLKDFYNISKETILNVKDLFIPLSENYLTDNFSIYKYFSTKKEIMTKIEAILLNKTVIPVPTKRALIKGYIRTYNNYIKESVLGINCFTEKVLISIKQKKYIKAFLLMYLIYIEELISSRLSTHLTYNNKEAKIGYAVSIEKNLLDNVIGTKEDFREMIYASGIVSKNDNFKKLRIVTQGEEYLPIIQKTCNLQLPLRSYFVLAQLHDDYIQLILNQVATEFDSEEEQESIIIEDRIIKIQNIYHSLCLTMWNNMIENSNLIESCDMHDKNNEKKIQELFSLKTKKEFTNNLKQYVLDNVFNKNSSTLFTDTKNVQLSSSCSCKVRIIVNDLINVSLRLVIQDIASIISGSLKNKEVFGYYSDIQYIFSLIYFNNNLQVQHVLSKMLKEEIEDFNQVQELEVPIFSIQELPNLLLQPVLKQRPFLYKGFKIGTLHQVYSESYTHIMDVNEDTEGQFLYKSKRTDKEGIEFKEIVSFLLVKKGDIISEVRSKKQFYLHVRPPIVTNSIQIGYGRVETLEELDYDKPFTIDEDIFKGIGLQKLHLGQTAYGVGDDIPVLISLTFKSYSSLLCFSARVVGEEPNDSEDKEVLGIGEPMTLSRF